MARLLITRAHQVRDVGDQWIHEGLDLTLPRPPLVLDQASSHVDWQRANAALAHGLAACRPVDHTVIDRLTLSPLTRRSTTSQVGETLPAALAGTVRALGARRWTLPLFAAGWIIAGVADRPLLSLLFWLVLAFDVSLVVHELGHVLAFRRLSPPGSVGILVVEGLSARLVRRPLPPFRDVLVTISGPVAPLAVALPGLAFVGSAPLLATSAVVIALAHLVYVAFPSGDGHAVRQALGDLLGRDT